MFKFKPVSFVFLIIVAGMVCLDYFIGMPWWYYALVIFIYHVIIIWGSFDIRSQFYTKSTCSFHRANTEISLTFDDGPHPEITPQILEILKKNKVKATFFCIGKHVENQPELLRQIYSEGHTIGLHSYSHAYLYDFYPAKRVIDDLSQNQDVVASVIGQRPICFRPPYGVTNPAIGKAVKRMSLNILGWTVRSLDTVTSDESKIVSRIIKKMKSGSIILLHDHLESSPDVLRRLLSELEKTKFTIVPLLDVYGKSFFYQSNNQ